MLSHSAPEYVIKVYAGNRKYKTNFYRNICKYDVTAKYPSEKTKHKNLTTAFKGRLSQTRSRPLSLLALVYEVRRSVDVFVTLTCVEMYLWIVPHRVALHQVPFRIKRSSLMFVSRCTVFIKLQHTPIDLTFTLTDTSSGEVSSKVLQS